jgi:hypothetical protein
MHLRHLPFGLALEVVESEGDVAGHALEQRNDVVAEGVEVA